MISSNRNSWRWQINKRWNWFIETCKQIKTAEKSKNWLKHSKKRKLCCKSMLNCCINEYEYRARLMFYWRDKQLTNQQASELHSQLLNKYRRINLFEAEGAFLFFNFRSWNFTTLLWVILPTVHFVAWTSFSTILSFLQLMTVDLFYQSQSP